VGSMARAVLPRTRRRGRSLIVGKVAAAPSDLEVFFIVSSNDPAVTVRPPRVEVTGPTARAPYPLFPMDQLPVASTFYCRKAPPWHHSVKL
jgi:hypothetical protein